MSSARSHGTTVRGIYNVRREPTVTEPGLYRLIFMSQTAEALEFQRWVFHDLLPALRKSGTYTGSLIERLPDGIRQSFEALESGTVGDRTP